MSTQTIERNYRKNPHTARWLMAFHTAGGTRPVAEETDLLDEIPVEAPKGDARSPRQAELMDSLIAQITELDAELGAAARTWTDNATAHGGYWTAGREGTASAWISKMIAKVSELKAAAKATPAAPAAEVEDGRYAVEEDGVLKFFKVKNGRRPGFVFLDIQASDDWHKITNVTRIRKIVALIAEDPKAAMVRYGVEIGECGRCGRTLTSEYRKLGLGPICIDK